MLTKALNLKIRKLILGLKIVFIVGASAAPLRANDKEKTFEWKWRTILSTYFVGGENSDDHQFLELFAERLKLVMTGGEHGSGSSGGDPVEHFFSDGRDLAISKLKSFSEDEELSANESLGVTNGSLANEVANLKIVWIYEDTPSCAFTLLYPRAPVFLSIPTCRTNITSRDWAAQLLVHEALHHFGIVDENEILALTNKIFRDSSIAKITDEVASLGAGIINKQPVEGTGTEVGGIISIDSVWTKSNSPYFIKKRTVLFPNTTLTIEPGVKVVIETEEPFLIKGQLNAIGTKEEPIIIEGGKIEIDTLKDGYHDSAYSNNGTYLSGPRFEYVITRRNIIFPSVDSGGGGYWKNCKLDVLTGSFAGNFNQSYIGYSIINHLGTNDNTFHMYLSQLENNYIVEAYIYSVLTEHKIVNNEIGVLFYQDPTNQGEFKFNTVNKMYISFFFGYPMGPIRQNHFIPLQNGETVISLKGKSITSALDFSQNYWGKELTVEMQTKGPRADISGIRDIFDDFDLNEVKYSPNITAPIKNIGPKWLPGVDF